MTTTDIAREEVEHGAFVELHGSITPSTYVVTRYITSMIDDADPAEPYATLASSYGYLYRRKLREQAGVTGATKQQRRVRNGAVVA